MNKHSIALTLARECSAMAEDFVLETDYEAGGIMFRLSLIMTRIVLDEDLETAYQSHLDDAIAATNFTRNKGRIRAFKVTFATAMKEIRK